MISSSSNNQSANEPPARIVRLQVENVKRIKAVEITPTGDVVILGGRNSQGKSSILDAIEMVFRGARAIPDDPVRHGQESLRVVADIGTLVIERTCTPDRKSSLVIRDKSGKKLSSPQAILDKLLGAVSFDPLEFSRMKPRDQVDRLKQIVGLDFTELDRQRERLYSDRTMVAGQLSQKTAEAAAAYVDPDAPDAEVSIAGLAAELQRMQGINSDNDGQRKGLEQHRESFRQLNTRRERLNADVSDLDRQITELRKRLQAKLDEQDALCEQIHGSTEEGKRLAAIVDTLQDEDLEFVQAKIDSAEADNQRARDKKRRAELDAQVERLALNVEGLTEKITAVDAEKAGMLAAAKFPVDGLAFTDAGVTYEGALWSNMGSADRIRVSMGMGMAMNPEMPLVMIRDGSLLDNDSLAIVAAMASKSDPPCQCWIERCGTDGPMSVIIEDGDVSEVRGELNLEPAL